MFRRLHDARGIERKLLNWIVGVHLCIRLWHEPHSHRVEKHGVSAPIAIHHYSRIGEGLILLEPKRKLHDFFSYYPPLIAAHGTYGRICPASRLQKYLDLLCSYPAILTARRRGNEL